MGSASPESCTIHGRFVEAVTAAFEPNPVTRCCVQIVKKRPFATCGKLIGEWIPDCAPSGIEPSNL